MDKQMNPFWYMYVQCIVLSINVERTVARKVKAGIMI